MNFIKAVMTDVYMDYKKNPTFITNTTVVNNDITVLSDRSFAKIRVKDDRISVKHHRYTAELYLPTIGGIDGVMTYDYDKYYQIRYEKPVCYRIDNDNNYYTLGYGYFGPYDYTNPLLIIGDYNDSYGVIVPIHIEGTSTNTVRVYSSDPINVSMRVRGFDKHIVKTSKHTYTIQINKGLCIITDEDENIMYFNQL